MIDFSAVQAQSRIGRLLRRPLSLIPRNAVLPVLQGPLAGCRWVVGSATHGCWLGSYERKVQRAFVRLLRPGDTVFDVGAGVGFFTLLAHRLVGPSGRVVAFEPLTRNLELLRRHLALNSADRVTIFEGAVSWKTGLDSFLEGENPSEGQLDASGGTVVEVIALDDFVRRSCAPLPNLIKVDVEGGELDVLEGASELLQRKQPHVLLATHGWKVREACLQRLGHLGYDSRLLDDGVTSDAIVLACRPRSVLGW